MGRATRRDLERTRCLLHLGSGTSLPQPPAPLLVQKGPRKPRLSGKANEWGGLWEEEDPCAKGRALQLRELVPPLIVQIKEDPLSRELFPRVTGTLRPQNKAIITTRSWKTHREYEHLG